MLTRVVDIEVAVYVHDEVVLGAVGVLDFVQQVGTVGGHKGLGIGEVIAREQDDVVESSSLANASDCLLYSGSPYLDVQVVGLIHDAVDDAVILLVLFGDIAPKVDERIVIGTALANNGTIEASKVVEVDHTIGPGIGAGLHELVEVVEVDFVEFGSRLATGQELP